MELQTFTQTKTLQVLNKNKQSQGFKRMNYLFKAARFFSQINWTYSRYLLNQFLQVGEKKVIRIHRKLKRQYCKQCIAFMPKRIVKSINKITQSIKRLEGYVHSVSTVKELNRYHELIFYNMIQIQISLLKHHSAFSVSSIGIFCSQLSKALLMNDHTKLAQHLYSLNDLFGKLKQFKGKRLCQGYILIDVLLFNMSLALQKARMAFQNVLVESTGIEQFDQKKVIQKSEEMSKSMQKTMKTVLESKQLINFILLPKKQKGTKIVQLSCLWQTIQFVINKYNIQPIQILNCFAQIQHLISQIPILNANRLSQLNNYLFNDSSKNLILLLKNLEISKQFHLCHILSRNDPKLDIFSSVLPTQHIISNLLNYILKQNQQQSHLLFSTQHYNSSSHCMFLINYMVHNFDEILIYFHSLFLKLIPVSNQSQYYSKNTSIIIQINNLLQSYTPSSFTSFLNTLFKGINTKYSSQESIQILKLLVFNRFLLNPELHNLISPINHQFTTHANRIKNIFFPTKLKDIQSIITVSITAYTIFSKMCQTTDKSKKAELFISDKTLCLSYQQLEGQINPVPTPVSNISSNRPINHTSLSKNILNELSKSEIKQIEHDDQMMIKWLIDYKREQYHQNNQRRKYQQHSNDLDNNTLKLFQESKEMFKNWKQKILDSKSKYRINARPLF